MGGLHLQEGNVARELRFFISVAGPIKILSVSCSSHPGCDGWVGSSDQTRFI